MGVSHAVDHRHVLDHAGHRGRVERRLGHEQTRVARVRYVAEHAERHGRPGGDRLGHELGEGGLGHVDAVDPLEVLEHAARRVEDDRDARVPTGRGDGTPGCGGAASTDNVPGAGGAVDVEVVVVEVEVEVVEVVVVLVDVVVVVVGGGGGSVGSTLSE